MDNSGASAQHDEATVPDGRLDAPLRVHLGRQRDRQHLPPHHSYRLLAHRLANPWRVKEYIFLKSERRTVRHRDGWLAT